MCSTREVKTFAQHAQTTPVLAQGLPEGPASHLHDPMADGAILPLPQHHQADDYDSSDGHCNDQQADEGTAAQAEVLPQWPHGFLKSQSRRAPGSQ